MKQMIWNVHVEKLAEDLWSRMSGYSTFDPICDKSLNDDWRGDKELLFVLLSAAAKETFNVVDEPLRLFTDEQRAKVMEKVDLAEYASISICGDGLEIDRAMQDFEEMCDLDVVRNGIIQGFYLLLDERASEDGWEAELRAQLADLPADVVQNVVDELKKES
jgi:hypothetical protein